MSLTLATLLLPAVMLTQPPLQRAAVPPQQVVQPGDKIHPYLREQMERAAPGERLPVYFVMRDRLRRADLEPRPRLRRGRRGERLAPLGRDAHREFAVTELRDHMVRTQRELVDRLRDMPASRANIRHRNYLGNFVAAELTPAAIYSGAALEGVAQVWFDAEQPLHQLEDSAPLPDHVIAGNGPRDTRADEVWATGIEGAGILWMNADSGVRASHTDLSSVHPGLVGRLWENPGEVFNNGLDDDGNGYVDDYYGWSFASNDNRIEDSGGHGSATAGVFIAREGTTELGNSPGTRIMTARIASETQQWAAIQYAIENGAHGQTSSHSYKNNYNPPPNYRMHRDVGELSLAAGLIRTNSTSNNGASAGGVSAIAVPFNISAPGCLPPPWLHPDQTLEGGLGGVLGIGAHNVGTDTIYGYSPVGPFAWNLADLLASRSYTLPWDPNDDDYPWSGGAQMGLLKPDLTGPQGTRSVAGSSAFAPFGGTSNGTPSVASCLALALSANPSLGPEDMAMAVQTTAVDRAEPGKDNRWGAGKVDAWELTKMARNLMRVDGSVAHTVHVSVSGTGVLTIELDSIPHTNLWVARGNTLANSTRGEFTVRVASPRVFTSGRTDAQGNFSWSLPLTPEMAGYETYVQVAISDPAFGPFTGSNAIRVIIDA